MTLIIATLTASGIVLTAESRQTYRNTAGAIRVGSDNAMKLFKLTERCGVAISGRAFLRKGTQPLKEVGYFVRTFAEGEKLEDLSTRDVAEQLRVSLEKVFVDTDKEAIRKLIETKVKQDGGSDLVFNPSPNHLIPYTFKAADGQTTSDTG